MALGGRNRPSDAPAGYNTQSRRAKTALRPRAVASGGELTSHLHCEPKCPGRRQECPWQFQSDSPGRLRAVECGPTLFQARPRVQEQVTQARANAHGKRDPSADNGLIQSCLKGSEHAWSRLIEKYKRLIFSIPIKGGLS